MLSCPQAASRRRQEGLNSLRACLLACLACTRNHHAVCLPPPTTLIACCPVLPWCRSHCCCSRLPASDRTAACAQQLHPPARQITPATSYQHTGAQQHHAENCAIAQRTKRLNDTSQTAFPVQLWLQRHISSSPRSLWLSSYALSAPTTLSSSSVAIGHQVGRDYGCSTRRAAARCTSDSRHSIATMVSSPRELAFFSLPLRWNLALICQTLRPGTRFPAQVVARRRLVS